MLTYTPSTEALPPKADERPWALFLLCMLWLLPGMIGHNPWKPDEPHSVGIVFHQTQVIPAKTNRRHVNSRAPQRTQWNSCRILFAHCIVLNG